MDSEDRTYATGEWALKHLDWLVAALLAEVGRWKPSLMPSVPAVWVQRQHEAWVGMLNDLGGLADPEWVDYPTDREARP